jgi:nitrogen fixation/metabolism regulation signal transduction histidine kinase
MSAGVMVLDHEFHLISCNDSVERILQQAGVTMIGQKLDEIEGLQEFGGAIVAAFAAQSAQSAAGRNLARLHWQRQIECRARRRRRGQRPDPADARLAPAGRAAAATWWCSTISPT